MRPYFPHSPLKIFGFFLVVLLFAAASFVLINLAKGYKFEFRGFDLDLTKTGMIIFSSRPADANVTFDGKIVKKKSGSSFFPSKITGLLDGEYVLRLEKSGYIPWEKKLKVDNEFVTWVDYIILFPEKAKRDLLIEDGKILEAKTSPDLKKIAYVYENKEKGQELWYFDSLNLNKTYLFSNKEDSKNIEISDINWSSDASKVLFKQKKEDKTDLIAVNTRDIANPVNITSVFKMEFSNLVWSPTDSNELFWIKDTSLYKINLSGKTLSASLLDKVVSGNSTDDRYLYLIRDISGERSLWRMDTSGNNSEKIVKSLPNSKSYTVKYSTANGNLLIIIDGEVRTVYMAKNIGGQLELLELSKNASDALWSPNGKKILYRNEKNIWTYDVEEEREYEAVKEIDVRSAIWYIDSYHIAANLAGEYKVLEFDGWNSITLGTSKIDDIFFSPEFKYFFYAGDFENKKDNLVIYNLRI